MGTIYGSLFQRAMSTGLTNEPFQVILEQGDGTNWQVEEVKVFETGGGNIVTQSTGVSVGVADNGSITFTKIENDIQL